MGAELTVPPYLDRAINQLAGLTAKVEGRSSTLVAPVTTGQTTLVIRPISWKRGSQLTVESPGPASKVSVSNLALLRKLACVMQAPFGALVEPDVYWMTAIADGSAAGTGELVEV